MHHWYDRLVDQTDLPIVHIADAVAQRLRELSPSVKRVGVLGAWVTSNLGIYSKRLGDEWEWVYASDDQLKSLVMPGIAAVKAGDLTSGRTLFLAAIEAMLAQRPDAIVLACTEIPVVIGQGDVAVPIVDSTEALARYTISMAQALHSSKS